jgi:hypothetical protein
MVAMPYQLVFDELQFYDPGKNGISVPVILKLGDLSVISTAKIDSGASHCILERYLGEELGLRIEDGYRQATSTVTGSFITYGHELTLSVLGFEFDSMIYFAEDESFTRNVLGRQGWLNKIRLGIVDYEGKLYLSRSDT